MKVNIVSAAAAIMFIPAALCGECGWNMDVLIVTIAVAYDTTFTFITSESFFIYFVDVLF